MPSQSSDVFALVAAVLRVGGRRFILIVGLALLASGLESAALAALPLLLKAAAGGDLAGLHRILGAGNLAGPLTGYVALVAVTAALFYRQTMATTRLVLDDGETLRMTLHRAVLTAGWGTPVLARPADLVHALTVEAGQCAYAVQLVVGAITRLITLPPLLIAALLLSPGFTLAAVALAGVASLPMIPLNRRSYRMAGAMARAARAVNAELAEQMAGLRVLKMLRAEAIRSVAFARLVAQARTAQLAQTGAIALVTGGQRVAVAAAAAAGGYYGLEVLHLDGGSLAALILVFARLFKSIGGVQDLWRQLTRLLPVHGQLAARIKACQAAAEPEAAAMAPHLTRAIRLEGVGFTHPGAPAPALCAIDLDLPAFSTTALAGPSGAGKSTLADLVMGLTAPSAGRLLVDDAPLDGAARVAWRGRVAYVPQDPFLFHDTIRANLLLARPAATQAELVQALKRAAARFVLRLPEGLDTIVGERGARLSGGERQRIALARALLMAPDLLVLDEATNALDRETEAEVIETLRGFAGQMTMLIIAHRRSAMAVADRVVRLEGGRIIGRPAGATTAEDLDIRRS
jgi:ATP-binding cassette subfamily C protein